LREDDLFRWKVTSLKTRDQSINFANPSTLGTAGFGGFTGDPEIDRILLEFLRPPRHGAA